MNLEERVELNYLRVKERAFGSLVRDMVAHNRLELEKKFTYFSVNMQNADGETLLHYAVFLKLGSMIEFLLERGADWSIENRRGFSPAAYVLCYPSYARLLSYFYCIPRKKRR